MKTEELGLLLRARRTAAGRTIASVAVQAGLSVPYIANLENGRGNPTLAALSRLAAALGSELRLELAGQQRPGEPALPGADAGERAALPGTLLRFARLPRFAAEAERLAGQAGQPVPLLRERLLAAMSGLGALSPGPLAELDWHRILDAVVLISRE